MISSYLCASKVGKLGHQIYNIVVSMRIYLNDINSNTKVILNNVLFTPSIICNDWINVKSLTFWTSIALI